VSENRTPVLFIHGLWLHATSWNPSIEVSRDAGYTPLAPGWPGEPETVEAARANPASVAGHGIDDVVGVGSARAPLIERFGCGVAEQHAGAAAVVVDQHGVDDAAHELQSATARAG
jgi:hypothetical protein